MEQQNTTGTVQSVEAAEIAKGTSPTTTTVEARPEETKTPEANPYEAELERLKKALSKANSEAAENKRKYLATLDEAQRAEEVRAEKEAEREARIAELEAKERFSTYKSRFMDAGLDSATAESMAKNLPDGVGDEVFSTLKTYIGNQAQALKNATLDNQPGLSVGMPPTGEDAKKAEINKLRGYAGLKPI